MNGEALYGLFRSMLDEQQKHPFVLGPWESCTEAEQIAWQRTAEASESHISEMLASHCEIRDGDVIVVMNNGQKLHESEAIALGHSLIDQVVYGNLAARLSAEAARVQHRPKTNEEAARPPLDPEDEMPPSA